MIKRSCDVVLATIFVVIFALPMLAVALLIKVTSPGPVFHWSRRIGKGQAPFSMPKFRTMRMDTPQLATHLLLAPEQYMTPIGKMLRGTSIDELPQLWSIIKGDMSFVGPRPALFNQYDLIEQRSVHGIDRLLPGLTGWAQINGRDRLSIEEKVALDEYYRAHKSLYFDALIILHTLKKAIRGDDIAGVRPNAPCNKRATCRE